tara:strand:+ start:70 stop:366 length:297 start_codon:yes stop_codon:yes gene_type:complete
MILYIFLKSILGVLSFISSLLFILGIYQLIQYFFFIEPSIEGEIFSYEKICGTSETSNLTNKKCQNLMSIYWLMVATFISFIFTLITTYPFFKIKKKK